MMTNIVHLSPLNLSFGLSQCAFRCALWSPPVESASLLGAQGSSDSPLNALRSVLNLAAHKFERQGTKPKKVAKTNRTNDLILIII